MSKSVAPVQAPADAILLPLQPLQTMHANLRDLRVKGFPFRAAWPIGMKAALSVVDSGYGRWGWQAALRHTKSAWESSYNGTPPSGPSVAAAALAAVLDAEDIASARNRHFG